MHAGSVVMNANFVPFELVLPSAHKRHSTGHAGMQSPTPSQMSLTIVKDIMLSSETDFDYIVDACFAPGYSYYTKACNNAYIGCIVTSQLGLKWSIR